jgi:uncharacterized membrane protein YidH (DUF202 family)
MNNSPGIGLTGFGVVLVVIGAIMRYAVTVHTSGFNIHTAGVILLWVGIAIAVLGLIMFAVGGRSRSTTRTNIQETPSGEQRTEQQDDWNKP